jgi:SAM-dependent methyltransferase
MQSATSAPGSAGRWGPLWGARAQDWGRTELQQAPTYEEAIRRLGVTPGQRVLDIGCGTGVFLRAASDRGAEVFGLDASEALLEIARSRVPGADLRVGDMQSLPYEDDWFDLVAGFNSFFFADDMVAALREAGRVAKPGAPVLIQVWGRPEACDLTAMKRAIAPFMPAPEPGAAPPPQLWQPGVLERLVTEAGLEPQEAFDVSWAFRYPDEDELSRGLLAAGGIAVKAGPAREEALRAAIVAALAPYRTPDGGYRLENEWHYLVARAPAAG